MIFMDTDFSVITSVSTLEVLYGKREELQLDRVPPTRPLDHTMYQALDTYVIQKLPFEVMKACLLEGRIIEVHGVYPEHLLECWSTLGLSQVVELEFSHKRFESEFNTVRPRYFYSWRDEQPVLAVAVVPGSDYVFHYATLIRHLVLIHLPLAEPPSSILLS